MSMWWRLAITLTVAGAVAVPAQAQAAGQVDLTNDGGTITAEFAGGSDAEGINKLIDDNDATKYFTAHGAGWVQYAARGPATVDRYTLTSGNDAPDRDPRDWTLYGWDGASWLTIDQRTGQSFDGRGRTRGFMVAAPGNYQYYFLSISATNGSTDMQIAELRLWQQGDRVAAAPSGLTALASGDVFLAWRDNASADTGYPESGYNVESSADGSNFETIATLPPDTRRYTDKTPLYSGSRFYRIRVPGGGVSATASVSAPAGPTDITDMRGTITDQYGSTGREGADSAADNAAGTKYFTGNRTTWLRHSAQASSVVTGYTITSGNDAPDRDPRDWVLEGSADGNNWTTLDTRSGQDFSNRVQRRDYSFANSTGYANYRLRITANHGSPDIQLAEWQLLGTATTAAPTPAVPTGLAAVAVSGDQAKLTWVDADRWDTTMRLERSTDGSNWNWVRTLGAGTTALNDYGLTGTTTYYYRVRAAGSGGASAYSATVRVTTGSSDLPTGWQEHWNEHNQWINRVYYDSSIATYYDNNMPSSPGLNGYTATVWNYTRRTYGDYSNPRLAVIFHTGRYGGGHPATADDPSHDYRDVIDMGLTDWASSEGRDMISHETSHIVEYFSHGASGAPWRGLWNDSKWAEIFQYDVYVQTGRWADADRWYADRVRTSDDFPRAGSYWFRDWFYPMWRDHGQTEVLKSFYELAAANFPQHNGAYVRDMNWGEFVHFWSGAAGVNLKPQASAAFGWPDDWERQFVQAQRDFPGVRY